MPVAQTWTGATGVGTVTFSGPVEFTDGGVPTAWIRGVGSNRRIGNAVSLVDANTVQIVVGSSLPLAIGAGWHYNSGVGDLRGVDSGLPVASFSNFLG